MRVERGARIGVVGAGAMGTGIAQIAATSGHPVVVVDTNGAALARAASGLGARDPARDREGGVWTHRLARRRSLASSGTDGSGPSGLDAFADCGLVVEAVVERLDIKRDLFVRLERVVAADCILATNTSSLPWPRSPPPVRDRTASSASTSSIPRPSWRWSRSSRAWDRGRGHGAHPRAGRRMAQDHGPGHGYAGVHRQPHRAPLLRRGASSPR